MVELHITELMEMALGRLAVRYPNRFGKAFYLVPGDWADFIATNPPMVETIWNGEPAYHHGFMDVPVRRSRDGAESRLYDNTGQGRGLKAILKPDGRAVQSEACRRALAEARKTQRHGCIALSGPELVASLGDGGFLTWQSSPYFMWLAQRLALNERRAAEATLPS